MSTTMLIVLAPIGVIIAWWLSRQRLTAKPWLEVGAIGEVPGTGASSLPPATIGLGVFLAVVSSLFALLVSAYLMRMQVADWAQLPAPKLLWFNTGALILSSVALQYALVAVRRGRMEDVRYGLIVGGLFALTFLVGQLLAWQQLNAAGYFLAANPANAFFYLFTGLHGLHLLGGLVALGVVADKAWRGFAHVPERRAPVFRKGHAQSKSSRAHTDSIQSGSALEVSQVRLGVQLCAVYWHFLLALWLVLFTLLTPWVSDFAAICREFLS